MECELLRSPMISYQSLLYNTTVLYDIYIYIYIFIYAHYNYNECFRSVFYHISRSPVLLCAIRRPRFHQFAKQNLAVDHHPNYLILHSTQLKPPFIPNFLNNLQLEIHSVYR